MKAANFGHKNGRYFNSEKSILLGFVSGMQLPAMTRSSRFYTLNHVGFVMHKISIMRNIYLEHIKMTLHSNGLFRFWTASGCIDNAEQKPASPSVPQRKRPFSVLRLILIGTLTTLCIFVLSSCGTLRISEADRKLVSEGKKSLLVTRNPDLLDFAALIPIEILIDVFDDEESVSYDIIEVDIEKIDGNEVEEEWFRANEEVAVEPGMHQIEATYTVKNQTKNSSSRQSDTQTINYLFEGGKRYKLYVLEHFDWYEICIGPY